MMMAFTLSQRNSRSMESTGGSRMNIPEYESLLSADASSLSLPQLSLLLPSLTTRVLRDLFNLLLSGIIQEVVMHTVMAA